MAEIVGSEVKNENEELRGVTIHLDNEVYCVNVMQVRAVLRYTEIAPVPGAPDYVLGIINLRGNVVTVIDTRMRFGLQPAEVTEGSRIVIIEAEKQNHPKAKGKNSYQKIKSAPYPCHKNTSKINTPVRLLTDECD